MIEIFKALSEESRLRILAILMERDMCVCEIEASLNMTQSNASRHLTILKNCGILECFKQAQWVYFSISESFKTKEAVLWEYLQYRLKELSTYESDVAASKKCKAQNLCC